MTGVQAAMRFILNSPRQVIILKELAADLAVELSSDLVVKRELERVGGPTCWLNLHTTPGTVGGGGPAAGPPAAAVGGGGGGGGGGSRRDTQTPHYWKEGRLALEHSSGFVCRSVCCAVVSLVGQCHFVALY